MTAEQPAIRVAFRVEGDFWNAYLAPPSSMNDAILIGSIHMSVATNHAAKSDFIRMMSSHLNKLIAGMGVEVTRTELVPGPEHERTGRKN